MAILVFVYGSLKKGYSNHSCLGKSEMVAETELKNSYLVDLGAFPGMLKGEGNVKGEVYRVTEPILRRLDLLEGHPRFYCREVVTLENGQKAWTYYLAESAGRAAYNDRITYPVVENGDWQPHSASNTVKRIRDADARNRA